MSSIWTIISRRIRSVLLVACPFCTTDYGPQDEQEEETPSREVYEPKKKNVRGKDGKKDTVIVDEEKGFSSKSNSSNSQCADVEVDNSDEVNRVMLRKSQFLPPEPYVPTEEELQHDQGSLKKATLLKPFTLDHKKTLKPETIDRKETLKGVKKEENEKEEKRKTLTFKWDKKDKNRELTVSPPAIDDNISQTSKKSKKSIFSFRKKKKGKKDGDNVSVFSFASFKSNKSVSSRSDAKDRKEKRKRIKQEKKDKKQVEKQKLNLSPDLNQQKFENIYPWMNEIEPLDDEVPNLMEEIRIREAQEFYNVQQDKPIYIDDKSYAADSFLDLGTQMLTKIDEPPPPPEQPKFGVPEGTLKRPLKIAPLAATPEPFISTGYKGSISPIPADSEVKASLISSDPETEGIVRKSRLPKKDSISEATSATQEKPAFKKKDIFENVISPRKFEALKPEPASAKVEQQLKPVHVDRSPGASSPTKNSKIPKDKGKKSPQSSPQICPSTSPKTKVSISSSEERDIKQEIKDVTEREEFQILSERSQGDFIRHKGKDKKKKRKDKHRDKSERSHTKKHKSPLRIESERIDDRSIDDIPVIVEKNLAADLTNPNLFPESPQLQEDVIPIVNYTRHWESIAKDDADKVDSIKEIQSTIDRSVTETKSINEVRQKVKQNKMETDNSTTRMIVDESLRKRSIDSANFFEGINMLSDNSEKPCKKNKKRRKTPSKSESKRNYSNDDIDDVDSTREELWKRRKEEKKGRRRRKASETDEERSERKARRRDKRKKRAYSESDLYKPNIIDSPEANTVKWISPAEKIAKKKRTRRKSKEENILNLRRPSKVDIGSPDSNTFSRDLPLVPEKPSSPARSSPVISPRNASPRRESSSGQLKPLPKHIARDVNVGDRCKKDFQMEAMRQKMDLDFQSVDTKRSIFILDSNAARNTPPSFSASKNKNKKKNKLLEKKGSAPKRRVSSRPNLDPVVSQEEVKIAPRRLSVISDDSSGSTLHSGDKKPVLVRRQSSFESNDSTLHDIDDIPSVWNASVRSRQFSRKSVDSTDSRITHRSQLSARSNRIITPEVKAKRKKGKKKK